MDRYPKLGSKKRVEGSLDASRLIGEYWPRADFRGGSDPERTWTLDSQAGVMIVAHQWRDDKGRWYLRLAKSMNTVAFED